MHIHGLSDLDITIFYLDGLVCTRSNFILILPLELKLSVPEALIPVGISFLLKIHMYSIDLCQVYIFYQINSSERKVFTSLSTLLHIMTDDVNPRHAFV